MSTLFNRPSSPPPQRVDTPHPNGNTLSYPSTPTNVPNDEEIPELEPIPVPPPIIPENGQQSSPTASQVLFPEPVLHTFVATDTNQFPHRRDDFQDPTDRRTRHTTTSETPAWTAALTNVFADNADLLRQNSELITIYPNGQHYVHSIHRHIIFPLARTRYANVICSLNTGDSIPAAIERHMFPQELRTRENLWALLAATNDLSLQGLVAQYRTLTSDAATHLAETLNILHDRTIVARRLINSGLPELFLEHGLTAITPGETRRRNRWCTICETPGHIGTDDDCPGLVCTTCGIWHKDGTGCINIADLWNIQAVQPR